MIVVKITTIIPIVIYEKGTIIVVGDDHRPISSS